MKLTAYSKLFAKRFFAEEDGMETLQVVLIVCVAAAMIMSVYNYFKNNANADMLKQGKDATGVSAVN